MTPSRVFALILSIGFVLSAPAHLPAGELHDEVRGGDLDAVKRLVEGGEDLNSPDENGLTPLLVAGLRARHDIANYLLAKGADPTIKSKSGYALFPIIIGSGWTDIAEYLLSTVNISRSEIDKALWTSASRGYDGLLTVLIRHGGNVNFNLPTTPLLAALRGGHMKTVELLIQNGADLNPDDPKDDPPIGKVLASRHHDSARFLLQKGARGDVDTPYGRPLHLAIKNGYLDLAEMILTRGASLKEVEKYFLTYVRKGELETVRFFISHGADIDGIRSRQGYNALMVASAAGNLNMVRLLIDNGVNIDSKVIPERNVHSSEMNGTALIVAASAGSAEVVAFLLSRGADVNASTYAKGDTALRRAAGKGYYNVVTRLLDAGADVNVVDFSGDTPLTSSLKAKAWTVADKLIEAGADSSIINKKGLLHTALSQNDAGTVDYLLSKRIDVTVQNEGVSPLMIAARKGQIPWVQTLLRKGADPNSANGNGTTVLMMALDYGAYTASTRLRSYQQAERPVQNRKEIAKILIEAGADVNRRDNRGMTVLDYAVRDDEKEIQEFLLENDAQNLSGGVDDVTAWLTAWRGVVAEKSTGRAIAGAVVVRSWEERLETLWLSDHESLGYREGITKDDGSFSVRSLVHSPVPSITVKNGVPISSRVVDAGAFVYRPGYKIAHLVVMSDRVELEQLPPDRELRKAELDHLRGFVGKRALRFLKSVVADEENFLRLTSPGEYRTVPPQPRRTRKFPGKPGKRTADEPIEVEVASGSGTGIAVSPDRIKVVKDRRENPPNATTDEKQKPIRIKKSDPPEFLRRALRSAKYTQLERARAAGLLGSSRTPIDVEVLAISLLDDSPVRDEACKSLAQQGTIAVETLIHIVDNDGDSEKARNNVQVWLPGVELSSFGIDERRYHARRLAIRALGMIGDERGIRSLTAVLRDPTRRQGCVQEAIKALGNFKTREVADILAELAAKRVPFHDYQESVFETLREMGEPALLAISSRLKTTAFSPTSFDRIFCINAIRFLGEAGDPRSVPALLDMLSAPDSYIRELARDYLGEIGDPRVVPVIMAAWQGEDPVARREATWGVIQLGSVAVEALRCSLADSLPQNRIRAAWALGWINDPSVIDDLAELRKDEVFEVRWIAIEALERFKNPAATSAIRKFCADETTGLRIVADGYLKARNVERCK